MLFLSRLIHPTTVASHYSATLIFWDGKLTNVVPANRGYGTHVWIVAKEWRDWLSETEAQELRNSMAVYNLQPPERIRRARSRIDHVFHTYYLDLRTTLLVSSFESLLRIGHDDLTKQFKSRVPKLAKEFGISITPEEARSIYDDRSVFVHSRQEKYSDVSDELIERYGRFEIVLRRALLKASTDPNFCGLFATDDAIRSAFGR